MLCSMVQWRFATFIFRLRVSRARKQPFKGNYIVIPWCKHHLFVFLRIRWAKCQDYQLNLHRYGAKNFIIWNLSSRAFQKESLSESGGTNLSCQVLLHSLGVFSIITSSIKQGNSLARRQETHLHCWFCLSRNLARVFAETTTFEFTSIRTTVWDGKDSYIGLNFERYLSPRSLLYRFNTWFFHWIGLRENLQESLTFHGKNHSSL